jgi:hypothetical protein
MAVQDLYPAQSQGGYASDIHSSLLSALKKWEAKRFPNGTGFKYGKKTIFEKQVRSATRKEISWNLAPEVKRAPCPRRKQERTEREKEANKIKMRERRQRETPEARQKRLEERRKWYAALRGDKYKAPCKKQTPEERLQSIREAKKRYMARIKAGVPIKKYQPLEKNADKLKAKAERQRKYYADFRKQLETQRTS